MLENSIPYLIFAFVSMVVIGWIYIVFSHVRKFSRKGSAVSLVEEEIDIIDKQKKEVRSLAIMLTIGVAIWFVVLIPNLMSYANSSVGSNTFNQLMQDLVWFLYIFALPVTAGSAGIAAVLYSQKNYHKAIYILKMPFFYLLFFLLLLFIVIFIL